MRLQPIDVYILDYFRRSGRPRIELGELARQCATYGCGDLEQSLNKLEHAAHMLRRISDGKEWLELTREGRRFAGLASAESRERLEPEAKV
jgi:hypothetical protein